MSSDLKIIDDKSDFTPNEVLSDLIEGDTSFQFYGYVDTVHKLHDNGKTKVFQFTMANGSGSTIKVVCFNDLAEKFVKKVDQTGLVLSLDKVKPKLPSKPQYLKTTCKYELHAQNSTSIIVEGVFKEKGSVNTNKLQSFDKLDDIRQYAGKQIEVTAFIKTPVGKVETKKGCFLAASVTDGYYKLQLTIQNDKDDTFLQCNWNVKGRKVSVKGVLYAGKNGLLSMNVKSIEDVTDLEIVLDFDVVINGFHLIP